MDLDALISSALTNEDEMKQLLNTNFFNKLQINTAVQYSLVHKHHIDLNYVFINANIVCSPVTTMFYH